jgi:predicted component of type VI protein secretion system
MVTLLKIANQQSVLLVKMDDGKEIWAKCPDAVKAYAQQNLKPGDPVDIVSETTATGLQITKIGKAGTIAAPAPAASTATPPAAAPAAVATPATTGAATAPAVQTPAPATKINTQYRQPMTPEEARTVRRMSIMASACNAIVTVQSQVDPNALGDVVIALYKKLLAEVEKP